MSSRTWTCLFSLTLWLLLPGVSLADDAGTGCNSHIGRWLDPASGEVLASEPLMQLLSRPQIVLLGESHTMAVHHRWQAYMLAALHSRHANMAVGFEMLPRHAQPVLDAWTSGKLSEQEFLEQSGWREVWGYDPGYYLPLLHFVRQHRLPAVALNVDRDLVSRVGGEGWDSLGDDERSGLSDPAPASSEYRHSLAQLYAHKQSLRTQQEDGEIEPGEAQLDEIKNSEEFSHFVDAQLTWDRAMAEALAVTRRGDPTMLVVGIVGRGHMEHGYGIPHQLADLGIDDVEVLLPLDGDESCDDLAADLARAVFVVEVGTAHAPPPRARLGVVIETAENGARVRQVVEDSVAAAVGILEGDVIQSAAGFDIPDIAALIEIVRRQAPGTWMPLVVRRGDESLEFVARFPQQFE